MFSETKQGFYNSYLSGQIVRGLVGIMIIVIIGVGVVLPVTQSLTTAANLTGVTGTIVSYFGTFVAIAIMLAVVGIF